MSNAKQNKKATPKDMFRATLRSARHTPFGVSGRDGSATASTALNPDDKPFVIFGKSLIFF
jgi:hypothetical protein